MHGMRDAVTQGPNTVLSAAIALYFQQFAKHNGYLVTDLGGWQPPPVQPVMGSGHASDGTACAS